MELPSIGSSLVEIDAIEMKLRPTFAQAKMAIAEMLSQTEGLRKQITSDHEHAQAVRFIQNLRRFRREVSDSVIPTREQLAKAEAEVEQRLHELLDPSGEIVAALSAETQRYQIQRERDRQEAEKRINEKTESQRKASEHERGILALRAVIATARQVADNSDRSGEKQTATEIRKGLARFQALDSSPQSFQEPLRLIREVRHIIALAMQNEQVRLTG